MDNSVEVVVNTYVFGVRLPVRVRVTYRVTYAGSAGVWSGPPDNWQPSDPLEFDMEDLMDVVLDDSYSFTANVSDLSPEDSEALIAAVENAIHEQMAA